MKKLSSLVPIKEIFQPGKVIDGFLLGEVVHRGGMAMLFSATKSGINEPILLKVPLVGQDQPTESLIGFETELIILRSLTGRHVPKFFGAGDLVSQPYIAMSRVAGRNLEDITNESPELTIEQIVRIVINLAQAVQSLHDQDVIHLDLKPTNIMIGADHTITLIDFGLSHHTHFPDLLQEEMRKGVGSAPYLSPEQVQGVRSDSRSDLFSIGVILYELLTNELPFEDPQTLAGLRRRLWASPTPPRALRPDTPPWLQEVVLRCLEVDPAKRYQSANRLRQYLRDPSLIKLTARAEALSGPGFWAQVRSWWQSNHALSHAYVPPSKRKEPGLVILVAIDTRQLDDDLTDRMLGATEQLFEAHPERRLICVSTISSASTIETGKESNTASGEVRIHLAQLIQWAKPLYLSDDKVSFHVLESTAPANRLIEFAQDNGVDVIVIGASHKIPAKVVPWRTVMTKIVEEAPCSVFVVR